MSHLPRGVPPGNIKAAIAAEVKRGELRQFYVKRVETGGPRAFSELNDEELQQAILEQTRELAELDPECSFAHRVGTNEHRVRHGLPPLLKTASRFR